MSAEDVVRQELSTARGFDTNATWAQRVLAALKTAGYAVAKLPERTPPAFQGEFPRFDIERGGAVIADTSFEVVLFPGWPDMEPGEARNLAAALLAAADAAERAS